MNIVLDESSINQTAHKILALLFEKRRLLHGEESIEGNYNKETKVHLENIKHSINLNESIRLILPAFPAKSPNRKKTLSHLPDMGEKVALNNLQILCQNIKEIYSPGAKLTICSDGRVFADIIYITDEEVTEYGDKIKEFTQELGADMIDFLDLNEIYPNLKSNDALREELMIEFGESLSELRYRTKTDKKAGAMYKGITRFIYEDFSGIDAFSGSSRNAIQNEARIVSYRVIQRSNAWSRVLEKNFPFAVRLSIHPQMRVSEKIGVFLLDTEDVWRTPWHSVAVLENGKMTLKNRSEVESQDNAALIFEGGKASHYQILPLKSSIKEDLYESA
jgi:pyoverdine/dityrosine biosynthesis protein Dit1